MAGKPGVFVRSLSMEEGRRLQHSTEPTITHTEQNAAIGAYIRWYNHQAEPKTSFALSSPIRSWTSCPAKAA